EVAFERAQHRLLVAAACRLHVRAPRVESGRRRRGRGGGGGPPGRGRGGRPSSGRSTASSSRQRVGCTYGHRVWNRHAVGGFAGLGRSPWSRIEERCFSTSGSGIGIADRGEMVYGGT